MYKFLGRLAANHPGKICVVWAVLGLTLAWLAPRGGGAIQDDDIRFLPARCDSVRGYRLLEQAFPQEVYASRAVFVLERPDRSLTTSDLELVESIVADLNTLATEAPELQIKKIYSVHDPFIGRRLFSQDRHCTLIQVALSSPYLAVKTRDAVDRAEKVVRARMSATGGDLPQLFVTGPAGVGRDLIASSASSLDNTTLATVVLVIVILLAVYRAPLLALVPLLTIAVAVWVALKLLALCTLIPGFYLVNVSQIFAIVMLYGAGTDYCLFLISRYREELAAGKDNAEALRGGVSKVGGALVASAATVICGLGLMVLAEFAKVKSGGPAIALGLFVALAASLTLAPALLRLLGPAVFWPRGVARETGPEADRRDLWDRVSRGVVRRPLLIWAASVALLLPLAWLGSQVRPNYRATGELSPSSSSVQGLEVLQRHFTAGETGPITVLLASRTDWAGPEGHKVLSQLSQGFARLGNVAEVRSFTQPLGVPLRNWPGPDEANSLLARGFREVRGRLRNLLNEQARSAARPVYLSTVPAGSPALHWVKEPIAGSGPIHVARLDVVLKSDPFDAQSLPTLETIQAWVRQELPDSAKNLNGLATETYGVTVGARDLATITEADRSRINLLVLAGVFLILLVLVRKPWLAAYLLVTVLFSYFATLGATTLVGQWFFGRPLGDVDWRVPFFLFTILVAVGEDYNILLMDRAVKERHRHGAVEGMRLALARTGGTITSCGVIMAGTFATLMLAGLGTLVQIGFALAFGVLLDTFVVRPLLVPAFVILIWKRQAPGTAAEKMCLPRRQVA